jgi:enamine deaminase RidA (YjgF/YER057c/UK114 family)
VRKQEVIVFLTGREAMKVKAVVSENPKPLANYVEAYRVGDFVYASGQLATDFKTGIPSEARTNPLFPYYGSDIKLQTEYILKNLQRTFAAAGSSLDHVFKSQVFLTSLDDFAGFDEVWKKYFKIPPARSTIQTTDLLIKDSLIEIDLIGYVPRPDLIAEVVRSDNPSPLAHYTEAFRVGDMVYASGQLATNFKEAIAPEARGKPGAAADIRLQTDYILENLQRTFKAAGSSLDHIAKAQVFLTNVADFAGFEEIWRRHFKVPPALSVVETGGLLIMGASIEIDLIGYLPRAGLDRGLVKSGNPVGSDWKSEAVGLDDLVFASSQCAVDATGSIAPVARRNMDFPYYGSDIKLQTDYILKSLAKTFEAAGCSLDDVIKAQVFMPNLRNFNGFDEVWKQHFKTPPARTTIGTTSLRVKDALVEIDLIAAKRS